MKKVLFILAAIAVVLPCVASADTVRVVIDASVDGEVVSVEHEHGFGPSSPEITVEIAGKTCTLKSSMSGSVPMGCNYTITVATDGSFSGELRDGNSVCTQSHEVAESCS